MIISLIRIVAIVALVVTEVTLVIVGMTVLVEVGVEISGTLTKANMHNFFVK